MTSYLQKRHTDHKTQTSIPVTDSHSRRKPIRRVAKAFAEHNVKIEWIPLETLIKGYGVARCMTQVIKANTVKKY